MYDEGSQTRTKQDKMNEKKTIKPFRFGDQGVTTSIKVSMTANSVLARQIDIVNFPWPKWNIFKGAGAV